MNENLGHSARVAAFALLLPLAIGCGDTTDLEPAKPLNLTVALQTVPTVVLVTWSTERPSMGYVEYGLTDALEYSTPMQEDAISHSSQLLGLAPNTTYYYRVVTWAGNDAGASDIKTLQTGALPASVPTFQVEGTGLNRHVVTPLVNTNTVVIINPAGTVVWAYTDASGLQVTRARLSTDRQAVLYNTVGPAGTPTPNSALVRVSIDGGTQTSVTVPDLGSDFVDLGDGGLGALAADVRDMGGTPVQGDKIVEVRDGVATEVWSTWDCFDPAVVPGEDIAQGWTKANALDFDAAQNAYYVSLGAFSSIVKVNRATRACEWVLGSTAATLTLSGGEPFRHQHQFFIPQTGPVTVMVMDNDGGGANASRVVEYALDTTAATATQRLSYAPTGLYTARLGEPTRLPGMSFVNWGEAGQLETIDSATQVTWKLVGAGTVFGYHDLPDALYIGSIRTP